MTTDKGINMTTQTLPKKVQTLLAKLNRNSIAHEMTVEHRDAHTSVITIKSPSESMHDDAVISTFVHTTAHTTETGRRVGTSTKHTTFHTCGAPDKKETHNEHHAIVMWALWSRTIKAGA